MAQHNDGTGSAPASPRAGHKAAETRKRILAAAMELFAERNYSNVRTRDIAQAAGVNIALIHRYFTSKKNLFVTVLASLGDENRESTESKDRFLRVARDYLSQNAAGRDRELRLVLRSAMDTEVSEVVRDFYAAKFRTLAAELDGSEKETRLFLQFSLIGGIALTSFLLQDVVRGRLDAENICQWLEEMLQTIHQN